MFRPGPTLTVNNAKTVLEAGLHALASGQTRIDLAELTVVDSAAVATLLAWQRAARRQGKSLAFIHLSTNLQSLAELYDVAHLLHSGSSADASTSDRGADLLHH
jgi:phospholipid transport system transporter-binding protein